MGSLTTTNFRSQTTDIPGLLIFTIDFPTDERGYYQENLHKEKLVSSGLPDDFTVVQTNISYNKVRGVTRGMHAEPWNKYLSIVTGKVFVAYVDLREGPSFGKTYSTEIDNTKAIYLPEGVANSFQSLEDDTYYIYSVDEHWYAEAYDKYCFVNLADPTINIKWPIPLEDAILNDRDRNHPYLKDAKKFEGRK